jgi:hypothetical protein
MHHYIITRFSILDENRKIFPSWSTSTPPVRENLFAKKRLDFKFMAFNKMTYPSIVNQDYNQYTWLIYTSLYLPIFYKNKLEEYVKNNIKVIYVENFEEMNNDISNNIKNTNDFTTIRLDDDDGLFSGFLKNLNKYSEQKNKIISFPNGIRYAIDKEDNIIFGSEMIWPKNAFGMSAIGFNIFLAGNHRKVDTKYEVIYDETKEAYSACCSEFCDTKREFL